MAEESADYSTLDDPASLDHFMTWVTNNTTPSSAAKLRGGDRAVSRHVSEASAELEFEDTPTKTVTSTETTRLQGGSSPIQVTTHRDSLEVQPKEYAQSPKKNDAFQDKQGSQAVPLEHHVISNARYSTSKAAGGPPSSIVSVANWSAFDDSQSGSRFAHTVNKLDVEPPKDPATPTQKKLLDRVKALQKSVPISDDQCAPNVDRELPQATPADRPSQTSSALPDAPGSHTRSTVEPVSMSLGALVSPGPNTRDAAYGTKYNPMAFFNEMQKQYIAHAAMQVENHNDVPGSSVVKPAPPLDPRAEEFTASKLEAVSEETPKVEAQPEQRQSLSSEATVVEPEDTHSRARAATDSKSEGGLDLTPLLSVIGARSVQPPLPSPSVHSVVDDPMLEDFDDHEQPAAPVQSIDAAESTEQTPIDQSRNDVASTTLMATATEGARKEGELRTVVIEDLPYNCDYSLLQSLVHSGTIESMSLPNKDTPAHVTFTRADECQQYLGAQPNGIVRYRHGRQQHIAHVRLHNVSTRPDDVMQAYLNCGATRVIQAEGVDEDLPIKGLYRLARSGAASRGVDSVVDSYRGKYRAVEFRFASIQDAVDFRREMNQQWDAELHFGEDPCAKAVAPRPT